MFTEQTITIDGTALTLPKVQQGDRSSTYESADGGTAVRISHSNGGKRVRSVVRVDRNQIGADPLNPSTNRPYVMNTYLVVDTPVYGFTDAEVKDVISGLLATIQGAGFLDRFLGQES